MTDLNNIIENVSDLCAQAAERNFIDVFNRIRHRAESPIEQAFLAGLLYVLKHEEDSTDITLLGGEFEIGRKQTFDGIFVYLQGKLGIYRADLVVVIQQENLTKIIVIECDGHEFHERTKAQAARDRSRDRWMAAQGYQVIRFTGAEIWKDPVACARQAVLVIYRVAGWLD